MIKDRFIDISLPVFPASIVWPGAPKTEFSYRRSIKRGDRSNNSNLFMNCHTGTHVDAPLHFIDRGLSVDQLSLEDLVGDVDVLDLSLVPSLSVDNLEKVWPKGDAKRVLFKTTNSKLWGEEHCEFVENFHALSEESAQWLVDKKVRLIGIDYLSIQRFRDLTRVHQILLEASIVLLEGLNLLEVPGGRYELICLPLKLSGLEAAPARAILRKIC